MARPSHKIMELLAERGELTNREVAAALGVSAQSAHRHLRALVEAGELRRSGRGRSTVYRGAKDLPRKLTFATRGLAEDRVWEVLREEVSPLGVLTGEARSVFSYAVTELVNNAIDHSGAAEVVIEVSRAGPRLVVEVCDAGIGVFAHIKASKKLDSELTALQEVSKGKLTTMPSRHTGEGLFFVSKVADRFVLESGTLRWIVDNIAGDVAAGKLANTQEGTRVRFEADSDHARSLKEIFDAYTIDFEFSKTRTHVKLFALGVTFISRSEAKRLLMRLDQFNEVTLDFEGVHTIGQGFADEVFRIWASQHPDVALKPVNMIPVVEMMVRRAQPE